MQGTALQLRRLRRWRALGGFGGLALCCCFFMPMFPVCSDPLVPSEEWVDLLGRDPIPLGDLAGTFIAFGVPYLFGLFMVIVAVRGRSLRRKTQRTLGISASVLFGIMIIIVAAGTAVSITSSFAGLDLGAAIFILILLGSLAYYVRSLRMGASGLLCMRWYFALCCTAWFSVWLFTTDARYGLKISALGTLLILIASTAEAKVRCRSRIRPTLANLLRCSIQLYDLEGPRCFGCGYLLIGLPSNRCPECGLEFDPAEHGIDEERTGTPPGAVVSPGHARG